MTIDHTRHLPSGPANHNTSTPHHANVDIVGDPYNDNLPVEVDPKRVLHRSIGHLPPVEETAGELQLMDGQEHFEMTNMSSGN